MREYFVYFPFSKGNGWIKRSAVQPQAICSEFPKVFRMWRIREVGTIMGKINLSDTETRKLQTVGLEMIKYFDVLCRENQLTYFLCGGCCIGAVRNKGFIPWDDDVDVFMPREDYERLKKVWTDSAKYSIQFETLNTHTANQFVTIHDNETTFIETYKKDLDINHGMKLDVLPLDGCPQGVKRRLQKLWALAYALFIVGKAPENHGKGVYRLGKLLLSVVPSQTLRSRIWQLCETQMSKYPISACPYVTELCSGPRYLQMEYPAEVFSKQKYVPFEDTFLPIPIGYDTYLTMAFGDYMTPPPPSQRVCHHEYECLDAEHSYRVYRGDRYFVSEK